ncbi:Thiosulfate sulfurtransferase [bioreactor metagenome]|uniref:Thiosulfate sulfurtransferase n=1 Tax=bioreactor metagenome TaxID=1076179 RepID=A0A645GNX1_9ZZZZ
MTKTKNVNKAVAFTIKQYVPNYTATTEWINNNLGKPGLVLLDVRTEPEFLGKIRPFQEKRAGHLPGAINVPRESFLTQESHFKPAEEVQALLAQHGVTPDSEIVVYDTAGVRSAFVTMLLRYSGFTKSQSYDEGFQAWAGDPELPLVKP